MTVSNFTICDEDQTALLGCTVSNIEDDLNVWVTWSTSDGETTFAADNIVKIGNIFYLPLHNAKAGNYICNVFSTYSPNIPEDTMTASVVMIEGQKCFL